MKGTIAKSLLAACTILCASCSSNDSKQKQQTTESLPKVTVETVSKRNVTQQTSFTGSVEAYVTNNIAPQQPRRIQKIMVDVGDHVQKGQLLVQLDASSLVQAKAQLENYKTEYERAKELYEFGGASKSEYDARKLAYEVAKSTYDNLEENTTLVSPITGVVSARNYDNGDMYTAAPVLVVEQIRPVKIMINLSETLFSKISKGMTVYVTLDAYGDEEFKGSITKIYPTIDNATRTFSVEVSLPNSDERVRPGMFARVTLPYGSAERIVAPDRAINKLTGSGDRYVWVYQPDTQTVRYSKVEIGRRLDNEFEILSGIEEGEQVVVMGQLALTNGAQVELNK